MTRVASERPSFFEGQYLGADDLESVVGYLRDHARRHALGGHTWGIAAGLDLIEQSSTAGEVDVFLLPGYAWDGYGRVIVNTHPVSLSLELMKGAPTGLYEIWIWYRERGSRGVRPGFETCGAEDAYERTGETFGFAIGPRPGAAARSGGVTVADSPIPDPREALSFFDPARGVAFDASVPHQQLEEANDARWLVPVGKVSWVGAAGGAAGHFAARTENELRVSRSFRRHAGLVAEGIQAADGLIRLRGRESSVAAGVDLDQAEGDAALRPGRDFDTTRGPTAIDDLVWIEGNARGLGHHRLWGTKLELRNGDGGDDKVPLYLRRAPAAGLDGTGRDLEIAIGEEAGAAGRNRLIVGTTTVPQVVVNDRGQVGIGALDPRVFHENARDLVIAREAASGLTIKSGAAEAGHLYFADGDAGNARDRGRITYDHGDRLMSFGVEGTDFVHFTEASQVGIGTDAPGDLDSAADDLVIQSPGNTGMTLVSGEEAAGSLYFATSADDPMSGFITYDHDEDAMRFGTAEAVRVTIRSDGDVGVGVDLPRARVHVTGGDELELGPLAATPALVLGPTSGLNLAADHESIQARSSSLASALGLQPLGGRVVVHGRAAEASQVVIDNGGRFGLGTSPSHAIHVRRTDPDLVLDMIGNTAVMSELVFRHDGSNRAKLYWERVADRVVLSKGAHLALSARADHVGIGHDAPDNPLHVKGARSGNAADTAAHVALIENTDAGNNADVLALKIGSANAGSGNNFVTFFAGGNPIGRIEGAGFGNSVSYVTSGSDFAEWLPRAEGAAELGPGDVVGIRDGKVSRDTEGASALGVISDRAGFVGNCPSDDAARSRHALVALVGQLPVRVAGPVRAGDFLIPSGRGDGTAIAVTAEAIAPAALGSVLGRAWTGTTGSDSVVKAFVSMTSPVEAATARACAELDRRLRALEPGGRDT
jgi:hypothetical protein